MIKLYELEVDDTSREHALEYASSYTGIHPYKFQCEVLKEPKRIGLFKKEKGIYHCWYEYEGMNADREKKIVEAKLYVDITKKKILVNGPDYALYEIDCSDLIDYELVINSSLRTYTVSSSNNNKALKGAILFGTTGAIVGAANTRTETVTNTYEVAELVVRLRFEHKSLFDIKTYDTKFATSNKEWQTKVLYIIPAADEFLKEILEEMRKN